MSPAAAPEPVYICGNRFPELYTCKKCLFRTDLSVFYNKHVQSTHQNCKLNFDYEPRKHVCQECRLVSHSLLQWFAHRCNKCPKKVNFLSNHWQTVHEAKGVFKCDKCSFISSRPEYLKIHYQTIHQAQKWYTCLECPFGSLDQCSVALHVQNEHKEISVQCDRIQRSYKDLIQDHINEHSPGKHHSRKIGTTVTNILLEGKYRVFKSQVEKTMHEVKGVFKCDKCSFISSRPEYLKIHNQTKHQAQKWYTCSECPFGSLDQCFVRFHVRREHKMEWKEISILSERINKDSLEELIPCTAAVTGYNCKHCSFKTKNKYSLSIHVTLNHVKCPFCNWRSPQRYQLKEHILDKHQCYSCSNRYLELYTCKNCTFDTKFYVYYQRHVQLVHRKCKLPFKYQPKRHVCNRCKFATHSWLHWFQHRQRPCRKIGTTVINVLLEKRSRVFKSQVEKTCESQRKSFRQLRQVSLRSLT